MQSNFDAIRPAKNERGIVIGRTGCGKTTLTRYLLNDAKKPYCVIYDAKGMINWQEFTLCRSLNECYDCESKKILYQPSFEDTLDLTQQSEFFYWIYNRYYTRLYVDEAYSLLGGTNPNRGLLACLSRGRERGISALVSCQRPARIPLAALSEAENYYIFSVTHPADKQRIEDLTAGRITYEKIEDLKPHEFYYYNSWRDDVSPKLKLNFFEE